MYNPKDCNFVKEIQTPNRLNLTPHFLQEKGPRRDVFNARSGLKFCKLKLLFAASITMKALCPPIQPVFLVGTVFDQIKF